MIGADFVDEDRHPVEPWALRETAIDMDDLGRSETVFALGNGYLGMRANPEEGRLADTHGTFVNGFHETWPIQHAEEAFGFAKTGQTIVNVPDGKLLKLYVDDEPLQLHEADLTSYERVLDFRAGILVRTLDWLTPAGKRVRVRSERMVSFVERHLAVMTFEVTMLDAEAPIAISSQLLNRQDGEDEYHVPDAALGEGDDPRRARRFSHRVLQPRFHRVDGDRVTLGYRCTNSGMTLAVAMHHEVESSCEFRTATSASADVGKTVVTARVGPGQSLRIVKYVTYHTSRGVPPEELADRCERTFQRALEAGHAKLAVEQRQWLDDFWSRSDIAIEGDAAVQQAVRWNLFQLAQATGRVEASGVAAKGVSGQGYEGHYFWDTEVYVLPFLAYTSPQVARNLIRFRTRMLPLARLRATQLRQRGALYPWRTINGEEASAYYAAGTAQYHINADVVYALHRYVDVTGDIDFLHGEGAEMLVETARLWEDLGFYDDRHDSLFHIHGVTGPDEYTTVVNDNLYTNVMARFNLRFAATVVESLQSENPTAYRRLAKSLDLGESEPAAWHRAADAMCVPYDPELGIHPQDASFLERERWDFAATPADHYPLLLHYHPLVIYRHQVLKQADVVLALFLRNDVFTYEEKKRDFDYYDPITTGDSSLSACVQSVMAAELGYHDLAWSYFLRALYVDLGDLQGNACDGVHVASLGGVWTSVVHGFGGMRDSGQLLSFDPRLPARWSSLSFQLARRGSLLRIELTHDTFGATLLAGPACDLVVAGNVVTVDPDQPAKVLLP